MAVAALITWLLTAAGGFVMLGKWIAGGGHHPGGNSRLSPGLVFGHFALAVIGLVLWIAYLAVGGDVLAWAAFVVLLPVALLGFTMLARWLPAVRRPTGNGLAGPTANGSGAGAETRFPIPVVVGHGLLAATTLVLVLLTAVGVGTN